MRKVLLFIIIYLISFSVKSQNWDPAFVKSLEEYYFIPVQFEKFGEWIADIEKDSSITFIKKTFTNVNDSVYLNFELQKPGLSPTFINSTLTLKLIVNTIINKKAESEPGINALVKVADLPPGNVITLNLYAFISFDATDTGMMLASQAQRKLEDQFGVFFANKRIDKSAKNIRKRRYHREVERTVYYKRKNDLTSGFYIRTYNLPDSNEVVLNLSYVLAY